VGRHVGILPTQPAAMLPNAVGAITVTPPQGCDFTHQHCAHMALGKERTCSGLLAISAAAQLPRCEHNVLRATPHTPRMTL
jgi:hypothetical protein